MTDIQTAARVVAERVMGWGTRGDWLIPLEPHPAAVVDTGGFIVAPEYFQTGNGMLELMEALRALGWVFSIGANDAELWNGPYHDPKTIHINTDADTAPDALILAAAQLEVG